MPTTKWLADLKTTLQVSKARLDVREKKKTEQVAKERYTVADYVRNNKVARARIAVEHLVREDYKIEAMDRIEAYVDTLLMRMSLIKDRPKNGAVDPAVEQPLANILWASPFLSQDIPELCQVTAMFKKLFGPEYVSTCEQNKLSLVDLDLLRCLSCDIIPKLLIEKYLVEICRSQNVPFEPDSTVMVQDQFWNIGQRYLQNENVNDEKRPPQPPPPPPSSSSSGGTASGGGHKNAPNIHLEQSSAPEFEKPPPTYSADHLTVYLPQSNDVNLKAMHDSDCSFEQQPQYPNINFAPSIPRPPPPASSSNIHRIGFNVGNDIKAPFVDPFPQVPSTQGRLTPPLPPPPPPAVDNSSDDAGFDDLARRFEELKKRK